MRWDSARGEIAATTTRRASGVTAAFRAEIAKIVELIPPQELAIDLAVENRLVDTALAREGAAAAEALAARLAAPAADIAAAIPQEVALGYHGCFGTLSGSLLRQPPDLGGVNMYVFDRDFLLPLAAISLQGFELHRKGSQ
jgi:hypothetical protein